MTSVTDGRLHRLTLHLASEREIARRVRAWRRAWFAVILDVLVYMDRGRR